MALSDLLVTDDLTILLGLITASIFLLFNLYKPQSLVHPILLGRQSDVSRVRNPGESAVHRNYGTGIMGRVRILACLLETIALTGHEVSCAACEGGADCPRLCQARL